MAGRANLGNLRKNGVFVAVRRKGFHILEMAACLALHPEFITASAVIRHFSCFQGRVVGLLVHVGHHQHFIGLIVLHNNRHMPVAV